MKPESIENDLAVVEHLAGQVANWLGDRDGNRHPPPWEPRQQVVLGVLQPTISFSPRSSESEEAGASKEEAYASEDAIQTSVQELLSSGDTSLPALSMSFRVSGPKDTVNVVVDLRFALYAQEYPSRAELLTYVGGLQEDDTDTLDDDDEPTQKGAKHSKPVLRARQQSGRRVSVPSAWRRINVQIDNIAIEVPLNEEHVSESRVIAQEIHQALGEHYSRPEAARPFSGRTRTVRLDSLKDEKAYANALREAEVRNYRPEEPKIVITGFAQSLGDTHLVNISVTNATVLPEYPFEDLAAYDCRLRVRVAAPATIMPQRFVLAPRDYRYMDQTSLVYGQGIGCVVDRTSDDELTTTTLPRYYQRVIKSRTDHVPAPDWGALATNPDPILDGIEGAMRTYLERWGEFLDECDAATRTIAASERKSFDNEIARFRLGRRAMRLDPRLDRAFRAANAVFANAYSAKPFSTWRLFQIVYLVSQLPGLAAREHRDQKEFIEELTSADVLWIPTGGGKTEAYLGLLVTALFYDRLRGKTDGVTAWLKFPLRMLSVQQLARVLQILISAEQYRRDSFESVGQPFTLGYLVGGSNTPNRLRYKQAWWPGFEVATNQPKGSFDDYRLVTDCPYCHARKKVGLDIDSREYRIKHVCRSCSMELPIYMTDDEVYRYLPSVLVGTVDKLTGFSHFGEFTQFNHGPRWKCQDHGGFAFMEGGKCLAGDQCRHSARDYALAGATYDPVPALIIQDELHLVREELGAFDSHYEGLLVELQRSDSDRLPSKMLAASATIEQYEDQIRQIYGRKPRSFPCQGFERTRSFYSEEVAETRRVYLGVLPNYRRKADVAGMLQTRLLSEIANLQDGANESETLFLYETSLAYVNSKIHGDQIADEIGRLSDLFLDRDKDPIAYRVLTGQVRVSDLAEAIDQIELATLDVPRKERLRALVGTSVVSHGVDLERLNILIMAGLPTTVADYIQATSRSGRTYPGLVVTVFDAFSRRERSTFNNFVSFHRFLDRMVEPVPVNKYALFGAQRTLPGIALALLWDMCRSPHFDGPKEGIRRTRSLQPWWNAHAARLKPILRERIGRCYSSLVDNVNERSLEEELFDRVVKRWENHELLMMQQFDADRSAELFASSVLSSFRDVDERVGFGALRYSAEAFESLIGTPIRADDSNSG